MESQQFSPVQYEWFCLKSKPKSEHIAAKHLQDAGFDVFLPRIRFQRLTRRGKVWFTEALFPGYLFSHFDRGASSRHICSINGVTTIVHFGGHWPAVPPETIAELRSLFGTESMREIEPALQPGDEVKIAAGPFAGLMAVVNRVLPAPERIRVLLEFLGRQTSVEIQMSSVIPMIEPRAMALEPRREEED